MDGVDDRDNCDEEAVAAPSGCRTTCTRHDDWLHRGPFLADLPWQVYMMRVRRARKPSEANAKYTELFFFDAHYALSKLYCQEIRYGGTVAVPRVVGSICPSQDEECRNKTSTHVKHTCPCRV